MLERILTSLSEYSFVEWLGLLTGIIYIILSARNQISCWLFGIISCTCIAYHDFFGGIKLYSDGVLQIFYVLMGFYGIYQWRRRSIKSDIEMQSQSNLKLHILVVVGSAFASLLYGFLMNEFTDAAFPYIDAFTTFFSIAATFLLAYRMISAWVYFVIIDLIMSLLYFNRGSDLYGVLYLIFTIVALYAIWNWTSLEKSRENSKLDLI